MDYLRARVLWNHLEELGIGLDDVSQEIADRVANATSLALLDSNEGDENALSVSVGGLTTNDVARYEKQRVKLTQAAAETIARSLDATLNEVALYYYAREELDAEELHMRTLKLDESVEADLARGESELKELVSRLDTVMSLYQEAAELHSHLQTSLEDAMRKLPPLINANHTASNDLLALTIETSLLKLSVVRARMRASLYGYTSSTNPSATMARAVNRLYEKFTTQQRTLDEQERELQTRLQDYQQLLELVDGQGGGFAQVVEDLAIVKRETEDCRKDLRRLGWTEN